MRRLILFAALFLAASNARAVEKAVAEAWSNQLKKTSTLLKQRSYAEALPILRRLNREMVEKLGPGDESTYVLVVPLIQTAIAEIGSGDRAAGLWHWHMAQTLYPKSAESDLSAFGEPAAVLKRHILVNPRPADCLGAQATTRPEVVKRVAPDYPTGARRFKNEGALMVDVHVLVDGTVAEPRVVNALPTPLAYAALDALRHWRFTPGKRDGKPVATNFCITVNFDLQK